MSFVYTKTINSNITGKKIGNRVVSNHMLSQYIICIVCSIDIVGIVKPNAKQGDRKWWMLN